MLRAHGVGKIPAGIGYARVLMTAARVAVVVVHGLRPLFDIRWGAKAAVATKPMQQTFYALKRQRACGNAGRRLHGAAQESAALRCTCIAGRSSGNRIASRWIRQSGSDSADRVSWRR